MRQVIGKYLALAAVTGPMLMGFVSDTCASTTGTKSTIAVKANIAFAQPADLAKQSDITFGEVQAQPNDKITMDTSGNMRLEGKGEVLVPHGHPSVITIGDSRDQVMNFVPANYSLGPGVGSLQAHCVLKGAENGDCDSLPIFGKRENTLFIGMDMTVGDRITPVDNKTSLSFDMSVVYQ